MPVKPAGERIPGGTPKRARRESRPGRDRASDGARRAGGGTRSLPFTVAARGLPSGNARAASQAVEARRDRATKTPGTIAATTGLTGEGSLSMFHMLAHHVSWGSGVIGKFNEDCKIV
ncbi:MAG: hypothetical protein LBI87_15605 [Candidatus Accumulibacter sp.]|nr:hypothetical protein [Accumulibacter sp.]